jgi:hypothetical protein
MPAVAPESMYCTYAIVSASGSHRSEAHDGLLQACVHQMDVHGQEGGELTLLKVIPSNASAAIVYCASWLPVNRLRKLLSALAEMFTRARRQPRLLGLVHSS